MPKPKFLTWSACLVIVVSAPSKGLAQETTAERTSEEAAAEIILPQIDFEDVSLTEAIEYLRIKSRNPDRRKRGVNFLLTDQRAASQKRFSLALADVPVTEAMHKIAAVTGWKVRFDPRVAVLTRGPHLPAPRPAVQSPLVERASYIVFPQVQFEGATMEEAVELLRIPRECQDIAGAMPKPMNIVTHLPRRLATAENISMDLRDVSMLDVLGYIAELSGLQLRVDEKAFVLGEPVPAAQDKAKLSKPRSASKLSQLEERASKTIIPRVEFAEATVEGCLEFLRLKTATLHNGEGDSLAVDVRLATPDNAALPSITLYLRDMPLSDVLRYVAELARLNLRVDGDAYVLEAK
jgi:hypothetical protein